MTIFDLLPASGHGVTCDLIYRPRALMTRAQAEAMMQIASKHKPGTIRDEFMDEAKSVMGMT